MIIFEKKWTKHYSNGNDFRKYIYRNIGDLLINARRERNIRLEYLADRVGVKLKILEAIELGRSKFHWFALFRVLKYFGKTLEIKLVNAKYEEETFEIQEDNLT